jgi:hypothetical protein
VLGAKNGLLGPNSGLAAWTGRVLVAMRTLTAKIIVRMQTV